MPFFAAFFFLCNQIIILVVPDQVKRGNGVKRTVATELFLSAAVPFKIAKTDFLIFVDRRTDRVNVSVNTFVHGFNASRNENLMGKICRFMARNE